MREIKFRGKRIDDGRWVYGHYFVAPLTDENSGTQPEDGWIFLSGETRHCIVQDHVSFVVDPKTVGQFTGCYDFYRKEIYEGDHLDHGVQGIRQVYYPFMENIASFGLRNIVNGMASDLSDTHIYRIVGNIYDLEVSE